MKKLYYLIRGKCRKFKKPQTRYICDKTLLFSSICNKCGSEDEKILKKKNQIKY